jgi:eukaryotic-like serine/threonine-protein kinase
VFLVQRSQGRFGVKVVDFGIAKTPINTRLTKMGETLGSPMFMSPEACRGDDVDHRADLYSFGVVLYLMLCGRVPFANENLLKVLQMQVAEPLPPPRAVNPELSPQLAAVLERALAKDPDARYVSIDALLIDLEAAVPPGSDRLLIETQTGGASSFRMSTIAGQTGQRIADSQQLSRVVSQPLPSQASRPFAAIASSGAMTAVPRRRRLWALIAVPLLGVTAYSGWLALGGGLHRETPPRAASSASSAASPGPTAPAPSAATAPANPDRPSAATVARPLPVEPAPPSAPTANTIHLHLTSTPGGAVVELDGKRLGATPLDVDATRGDRDAQLVVSRDGFTDVKQRLDLRADQSLSLALPPVPRPRVIRRPPPPPPRVERRDARAGSAAPANTGSAAPPKGDPNLDIRLSR